MKEGTTKERRTKTERARERRREIAIGTQLGLWELLVTEREHSNVINLLSRTSMKICSDIGNGLQMHSGKFSVNDRRNRMLVSARPGFL